MELYQKAGVDIHLGNTFIDRIKPLIRQTFSPEVITDIGGFSGLFRLDPSPYAEPVLVSSTDGVGTKLKIAQQLDQQIPELLRHRGIVLLEDLGLFDRLGFHGCTFLRLVIGILVG